jgi:hypothetical protein
MKMSPGGSACPGCARTLHWTFVDDKNFTSIASFVCLYHYALQSLRLIVRTWLHIPTFATRRLHACHHARAAGGTVGEKGPVILPKCRFPFRDLLHAVKLRHGTDGFTFHTKEGVLRIFFALENPTDSAGFVPANLGTKGQHATSRPPKTLASWVSLPDTTGDRLVMVHSTVSWMECLWYRLKRFC